MPNGMFASVAFEENDGKVNAFMARDPVGIKPGHYGWTMGCSRHQRNHAGGRSLGVEDGRDDAIRPLVGHAAAPSLPKQKKWWQYNAPVASYCRLPKDREISPHSVLLFLLLVHVVME
mmetsp:Transcript_18758/g.45077  ORF Transcript_18758/g.45077 Transcript_18758/m.45077 type:complete len:118 (-) Transcript_18758:144-497(-)